MKRPHPHARLHGRAGRGSLQHRMFLSFGLSIVVTLFTSGLVFAVFYGPLGPRGPHFLRALLRLVAFCVAGNVLWLFSGAMARRIARPLRELARVASELGAGKLESRVRLPHHDPSEIGELAAAFNEMAARIESQMKSQKELLGAVSHELRTPLSRMRVLLSLLQDVGAKPEVIAKLEREIMEMDALVGELLAGARVDAGALQRRALVVEDLVHECVERAGLGAAPVEVAADARNVNADATLLSRALIVLLDNAKKHGGQNVRVVVSRQGADLRFCVEDDGAGFASAELPRVFSPFVRGQTASSSDQHGVGLGLYLVRRIAEAHGGQAFAENLAQGGARVGFSLRDTLA
ncbi:MAG TPA: ATP-binding protein [Polyangiales bacterium]